MSGRHCRWMVFPLAGLLLFLGGCDREEPQAPMAGKEQQATESKIEVSPAAPDGEQQAGKAKADLRPTEGSEVSGTVTFTSENGEVRIVADIEGLEPGMHGFHIHEKGDCSAPDAKSAGGHYNPEGAPHGAPDNPPGERHVGDLGNLEAGPDGKARYERIDGMLALQGEHGIIGKAVIIHAKPDDLESQPTGAAGPRVACGVIEEAEKGEQKMSGSGAENGEAGK